MKKNKTFAQRAKNIVKSYKRADWDPIEKSALESSLAKLQEEQEAYKQANQLGEYSSEDVNNNMKHGGEDPGSTSYVNPYTFPGTDYTFPGRESALVSAPNMGVAGNMVESVPVTQGTQLPGGVNMSPALTYPNEQQLMNQVGGGGGSELSPYSTSIVPSLISGATTVGGNLLMAKNTPSSPTIDLPRLTHQNVSYERGRQSARREAAKGSTKARFASSRGSRTRGEYLANRAASEAAIAGNLGETLNKSYQEETLINANMKAGMDRANAEIAAKEQIFNAQQKSRDIENKNAYLSAAMQAIPQTTRDIGSIQQQDDIINLLGDDYGLYMEKEPGKFRKKKVVKYNKGRK